MSVIIDITLRDQEKLTKTITINNLSWDLYNKLENDEVINELFDYKYYLNTVYDKISILDFNFILNKQSKNAVTLMQIN
ncbi:MAG: hypothetical protein KHZ90_08650 [Veillonella parvula]|uniref:Uncharacterized protein n=1 Tax=Veillonella parvula TaxID=29466 RepID=A0A943A6W9_VEIPA|nr:hypothetical protein [Veillonella parvula]MBS4893831.1 hypothetical protein [Veillonella parvula]